ncbi:MAG: lysylphosphatidylglycerol synthase transmembrane domain-containing protein [Chloroflexia bacterium]
MKRLLFLLIGLAISAVSLYLALRDLQFSDIWDAMSHMRAQFFLLMLIPYVLTFMTKVWRWRVLLHSDDRRLTTGLLFSALMISYIPLPFRLGEVARGALVSAKSSLPPARVYSTILVEKVLDVLTLLFLLGLVLPFVALPQQLQGPAGGLALFFLVGALALLVLVLRPDLARKLVGVVARMLPARFGPRIETVTEHALEGLTPMSDPHVAIRAALWSLATWGVNAVTIYFLMSAFNVETSPLAAVTVMVATNLGMAIPSAPGYVGTFELAVVLTLGVLTIPARTAQTFALVYHFIALVPVATMGVIAALQQGVGLAGLGSGPATIESAPINSNSGTIPVARASLTEEEPDDLPRRQTPEPELEPEPEPVAREKR